MSIEYGSSRALIENLQRALATELEKELSDSFNKTLEDFRDNRLPHFIAKAQNLVEVVITRMPGEYGHRVTFIIHDVRDEK